MEGCPPPIVEECKWTKWNGKWKTFTKFGKCRFGYLCCEAHGVDELLEWKERFDYRQAKLKGAKESRLQGHLYTEQLLEKWLDSKNPNLVMTDNLESVEISNEPELSISVSEKNCCREWTFHLSTKESLRHVALLNENQRNHFRISHLQCVHSDVLEWELGPNCQEWSNPKSSDYDEKSYILKVRFVTSIYGTFRQTLVFDFGSEPVLIRKLLVDTVSVTGMEELQQARTSVISHTKRWNGSDVTLIPFENHPFSTGEQEKNLLERYPPPSGSTFNLTHSSLEPSLTEGNYVARQHELLCIEEMAQYDLLAKYNIQTVLNIADSYMLTPNGYAKYSVCGELFACLKLSSVLSEDSASGRLVLSNCNTVLLAPVSSDGEEHRKVYEATIEDKGKSTIHIRLSNQCCQDLNLKSGKKFHAEVQFQLNRLPLCEMHFAVDKLCPPSLLFPDVNLAPQSWNNQVPLNGKLNTEQQKAVLAITAPIAKRLPPVLINGPFGTGKTYVLAQAVRMLLDQKESRILICTHSNSAADIYIQEYLHPAVVEGQFEADPLRVYYQHRRVNTVHPTVQHYSLINRNEGRFQIPTVEDIKKHKVVVTTLSSAKYLVQLKLDKGYFTHILIDEAAQAMECEAIMPLSLANENTRIVLAGDHMQLSPEGYSDFAKKRNLHTSLLERLYDFYPEDFGCKILLCENYRSHDAIVQYTSELFYNNRLKASGKQPRHSKYFPLTFFTAKGDDVQDCNSTGFHNNAEVYEIVEGIIELKRSWPKCWGDQDETSIGVVTPYYDQVVRIRAELRKRNLHGVSVERVLNVQGKQFRVIFISTVRTFMTCPSDADLDHGFLSNEKLLNTAITRAQSLVAVVGDPVSLTSVGKCRKLWEKFILTCHKERSFFGCTWGTMLLQLNKIEMKIFNPNPLAPEFVPGRKFHGLPYLNKSVSYNHSGLKPSKPRNKHPVNGVATTLSPKSQCEREMDPHPLYVEPSRDKLQNVNESCQSIDLPEGASPNIVASFQSSLSKTLSLLQKILPPDVDMSQFPGSEKPTTSLSEFLLAASRLMNNAQLEFNNSESFGMGLPVSPSTMQRNFPPEKFESGLFCKTNLTQRERPKSHIGLNSQPNHVNGLTNGDAFQTNGVFQSPSPYRRQHSSEMECPEEKLHHVKSAPEYKVSPVEQRWPGITPLVCKEPVSLETCPLSRLRSISSALNSVNNEINPSFYLSRYENPLPRADVTFGPLTMSYADDATPRSSENSATKFSTFSRTQYSCSQAHSFSNTVQWPCGLA